MLTAADFHRISRFQRERALRLWRMKRPFVDQDAAIRRQVEESGDDAVAMSARLVEYFWHAQRHYLHRHGTLAYYPGWPSIYGATNDAVEGVTRLMPLWAAYASSPLADDRLAQDMWSGLRTSLVHGTDPAHPGYWGDIGDRSTLICEAADVALALWLAGTTFWLSLEVRAQRNLVVWLGQAVGKRTADNNWHLFVVLVDAVLTRFDPEHRFSSETRLERIKNFRQTDGCFKDGPEGQIDFYNAWGFHYALFWLREVRQDLADESLNSSLEPFCVWYQWLFTNEGIPLFGRSLCYRYGVSAPLIACALRYPGILSPGLALTAYMRTWRFFTREGGLRAGRPTQGVFGDDIRWLDPYSGPCSSFWGTRSMVLFLFAARTVDWKRVHPEELPSMQRENSIYVPAMRATLRARPSCTELIRDIAPSVAHGDANQGRLTHWKNRLRAFVFAIPFRRVIRISDTTEISVSNQLTVYR